MTNIVNVPNVGQSNFVPISAIKVRICIVREDTILERKKSMTTSLKRKSDGMEHNNQLTRTSGNNGI